MRLIRPILTSFKKCSSIHRLLPKRPFHATYLLLHKIDYYSVLGISRGSDQKAVKVAYFRLAKKYHPDYNSSENAEAMFELISEAYEVISDPAKRAKYDEHGEVGETFGKEDLSLILYSQYFKWNSPTFQELLPRVLDEKEEMKPIQLKIFLHESIMRVWTMPKTSLTIYHLTQIPE